MGVDLKTFGERLRDLRKLSGRTQAELAAEIHVSPQLISLWERAYQHEGRTWTPDRRMVVKLVEVFAELIGPEEAQEWVGLLDYRLSEAELRANFLAYGSPFGIPLPPPAGMQANFRRLELPTQQRLFGVDEARRRLRERLGAADVPWLMALDGIGGIGKTSLAGALAADLMEAERFYDLAWVSAKQEEFSPGSGIQPIERPALDEGSLVDFLLEQLNRRVPLTSSIEEKMLILSSMFKQKSYLVVVDNLETVVDHEALLPLMRKLANPSKFLLTTRYSLYNHSDVYCHSLQELAEEDVLAFLRHEAEMRGMPALAKAPESQLRRIYAVVGGNPLALKLVVGQVKVFPLSQVLGNLRAAEGKKTDELYTYIYWQAWQSLNEVGRSVLLSMPLAQGGNLAQLSALSGLERESLIQALEHLVSLSLIEISGDLEHHRYRIHRLTETFLLNEVTKWQ